MDEINAIFREHGIGFELTPYVEHEVKPTSGLFRWAIRAPAIEIEHPRIIRRDEHLVHDQVIEPTLRPLSSSRFRVANAPLTTLRAKLSRNRG